MPRKKKDAAPPSPAPDPAPPAPHPAPPAPDYIAPELRGLAVPVAELVLDPENANQHGPQSVASIAASLQRFGQLKPIVAHRQTRIVEAGNGTLLAARELGWSHLAVVWVAHDRRSARGFALADNRTAQLATWDQERLAALLDEIEDDDAELAAALELDALRAEFGEEGKHEKTDDPEAIEQDEEPDAGAGAAHQEKWKTARGQLWIIDGAAGSHRLLCGDSSVAADVRRLMDGRRAMLMNTDPPYGVTYANEERPNPGVAKPRVAKPRVANDALRDADLQRFLESVFRAAAAEALQPNAAWYLWHAHLTQGFFAAAAAAAAANLVLHRQIIWVKPAFLLTRGQYHWRHEPCFMGWVEGHQPPDYGRGNGERDQSTVWEIKGIDRAKRKSLDHSTPKPLVLFAIPLMKHTKRKEICYEPFAGSGPQFIAAEKLRRLCYGIEIEPRHVATILERCQQEGMEPRLAAADG